MEDERAFVGSDSGQEKKSDFRSSSLLLLAPLESEASALVEGLTLSLGPSSFHKEGSARIDFPPFVTVQYLGPGARGAKKLGKTFLPASDRILVAGFSGGLSERVVAGRAYVLSSVIGKEGSVLSFPGSAVWARILNLEMATAVEVGRILERPGEKQTVYRESRADLADMESYSWMENLLTVDPDATVLRVVSDDGRMRLPSELMFFSDADGREQRIRGVLALLKNPPALVRFVLALPGLLEARKTLVSLGQSIGETLRKDRR